MTLDARFHLLDRQIIDRNDGLVAKVDDLELVERPDGTLAVTALLTGPGALGSRIGGRLGEWMVAIWRRLHPDRDPVPGRIPVAEITAIDSAVRVRSTRHELCLEGFEAWTDAKVVSRLPLLRQDPGDASWHAADPDPGPPGARRVSELLGHAVQGRAPQGHVGDLRLDVPIGADAWPVLGLIVNEGPIGFLFGPERRPDQGPWLVRQLVRGRRRYAKGYLTWDDVGDVDWDSRQVKHGGERLRTFEP